MLPSAFARWFLSVARGVPFFNTEVGEGRATAVKPPYLRSLSLILGTAWSMWMGGVVVSSLALEIGWLFSSGVSRRRVWRPPLGGGAAHQAAGAPLAPSGPRMFGGREFAHDLACFPSCRCVPPPVGAPHKQR